MSADQLVTGIRTGSEPFGAVASLSRFHRLAPKHPQQASRSSGLAPDRRQEPSQTAVRLRG
jgi:hypothetical protein